MDIQKVSVPEGQSGDWRIERFTVSEEDASRTVWACMKPGMGRRSVPAGEYTRLKRGGTVVMSDTPGEAFDMRHFLWRARGQVLLNGVGLGWALQEAARKNEVEHVTGIDASEDILNLIRDHYESMFGDKITLTHADAMTWKPPKGVRYGAVYHDIWDYICADNLPEMHTLHRRYGRRCDWQGSWARDLCEMANKGQI